MKEIWKDVVGYEDRYEVSNLGRMKSKYRRTKGLIIKTDVNQSGYEVICLKRNGTRIKKTVHRLVMIAFWGDSDLQVDHVNGCKTNNNLLNLRYCTSKENIHFYHKKQDCSSRKVGVHYNKRDKMWYARFTSNGKRVHIGCYKTEQQAVDAYNFFNERQNTCFETQFLCSFDNTHN